LCVAVLRRSGFGGPGFGRDLYLFLVLQARFGDLRGRSFAVLGLTYTPQTDTLRRSAAVELCHDLLAAGADVRAHDPAVSELPADLDAVRLGTLAAALEGADAAIVCTEWPEFREALWAQLLPLLRQPVVVDANRFLEAQLRDCSGIEHLSVGRAS
jgi:UDPglucose 6-dehydrogenase